MPGTFPFARLLASAAVVVSLTATALPAAAQSGGSPVIFSPQAPGPNEPPVGRSLFDELFEVGPPAEQRQDARYAIPFPFEALLDSLNERTAPDEVQTALIPLGRSLQRYAADPHYFASPRIVVAADGQTDDADALNDPLLKDRLFLGYQPASESIEVLSYNEAAGRFEFQEITGYTSAGAAEVTYSERAVCATCHQGATPIFATALWSETNGSENVANSMADLGESFHGVSIRQGVDGPDFFDQSTDRANLLPVAARLWQEGCQGADDPVECRGALLLAALRYRLGGSRTMPVDPEMVATALASHLPDGLWAADPDLPNRDPMILIAANTAPADAIEAAGQFDPTTVRTPIALWQPDQSAAEMIAMMFGNSDIAWLDERLAAITLPASRSHVGTCKLGFVGDREIRFACKADDRTLSIDGFVRMQDGEVVGGRVDHLSLEGQTPVRRLFIEPGSTGTADTLALVLREAGQGLSARLASGERLSALRLALSPTGLGQAEISVIDDIAMLAEAIGTLHDLSSDTPPMRRSILAALDAHLSQKQN